MKQKANMCCWFEIPVTDMDRAVKFYETVFNIKIDVKDMDGLLMGWFPFAESQDAPNASGSLICFPEHYKPGPHGVLIYLSSQEDDVNVELGRVEAAGGKVILEKKMITEEIGFMGAFIDTEGNRISLHSRN